jgi:hypothetical protein
MATANLTCEVLPSSVYFSCTAFPGTSDEFYVNYNGHEYAQAGLTPPYQTVRQIRITDTTNNSNMTRDVVISSVRVPKAPSWN